MLKKINLDITLTSKIYILHHVIFIVENMINYRRTDCVDGFVDLEAYYRFLL